MILKARLRDGKLLSRNLTPSHSKLKTIGEDKNYEVPRKARSHTLVSDKKLQGIQRKGKVKIFPRGENAIKTDIKMTSVLKLAAKDF